VSTAVIAVHFQNDVLHRDGKIRAGLVDDDARRDALVCNAKRLFDAARAREWPVVSVAVVFPPTGVVQNSPMFRAAAESGALREGTWGAEFLDGLGPVDGEPAVTHSRINAFYGSDLAAVLERLGARRVIVAGVATHSAVEHTARHAADVGYDVVVAADACASADRDLHDSSLRALALHVDRVATVDEIRETP
jgi:nicotinamidase-related amidase